MALLLFVLAVIPGVIGVGMWGRAETVQQQTLAAVFLLTSAVLLGASFVTDRVQLASKRLTGELQSLRAALLRLDAEQHTPNSRPQPHVLDDVR
jgi:hypothetical protein